jgi:hypothetical protein
MVRTSIISIIKAVAHAPRKGSGDFVGAVYDTTSPAGDFPPALVVGINYGQQASSASIVGQNQDAIGYAKHVAALGGNRPFHTVLWNFFPYLTQREWLQEVSNSADEAERVFDGGYVDPFAVFSDLVLTLRPELIVFHGVSSCVPVLARVAIRRVGGSAILMPNLARSPALSHAKKIA